MEIPDARTEATRIPAPATLNDVARAAGVSLATASRVLNGSTRKVADTYRERVEQAAQTLGYTTNVAAQAIARGTSATVALLVADIADPYFAQVAAGVMRGAHERRLVVTIGVTERDPSVEADLLRALRGQRPRGVILAASRNAAGLSDVFRSEVAALRAIGTGVVALGQGADGLRTVTINNREGASRLGVALGERGYRSAIILGATPGVVTSDERIAGFTHGFTSAGGHVPRVARGDLSRESGEQMMRGVLASEVVPGTLVFAVSDLVAVGACRAIRGHGRRVGDDIAVAGFDDVPLSSDLSPPLTTVRIPLEEIGYRALTAATDPAWSDDSAPLPVDVVLRASTPGG